MFPYIVKKDYVNIIIDGIPYSMTSNNENFTSVIDALKANDEQFLIDIFTCKKVVNNELLEYAQPIFNIDGFTLEDYNIYYNNNPVPSKLNEQILEMHTDGYDISSLCKFVENLFKNASYRVVNELYSFLECNEMLSITEDGCFLAYKKVREDYKDIYSGTFDNSPGQILTMERNTVNDDKNQTCSTGLHFCSFSYLKHFGSTSSSTDRVVIVKINPADVVSIPSDYNNAKGRCCRYEVVGEVKDWTNPVFDKRVEDFSSSDERKQYVVKNTSNSFNDMTIKQMVDLYNKEMTKIDPYHINIKKFRDKNTAIERLTRIGVFEDSEDSEEKSYDFLYNYTINQLVDFYNDMLYTDLVKFRDKKTAVSKVIQLIEKFGIKEFNEFFNCNISF